MAHKKRTLHGMGALLSLLWLAACSPAQPTSTPTPDLDPVRTQVAATVLAQVTRALALTPSITPIPSPTETPQPTATTGPTDSPTPGQSQTPGSATPTVETTDHAQWVSQSIADDTAFAPGEAFTMTWRLKNTGTSTWKAGYLLRYYSGETFGAPKEVALGQEVLPGAEVDISIQMKAPTQAGTYRSDWVMSSELRSNFKEPVYLRIIVTATATPTRTPTSTRTPTQTLTPKP
jgi:hypothetical protein